MDQIPPGTAGFPTADVVFGPSVAAPGPWIEIPVLRSVDRVGAAYDVGRGIGIDDSFTTLEFTPIAVDGERAVIFGDMRFLLRDDATVGANIGLGYRVHSRSTDYVFGANVFYDYRNTAHHRFHQLGLGAEALGPILFFRANGYLPDVGDVQGQLPNAFAGHRLILHKEVAMSGADFEVGVNLLDTQRSLARIAAGAYHFDGHGHDDASGWRARAEGALDQRYWLNVSVQNDDVFGTTAAVGLAIRFTHGTPPRVLRLTTPIERLRNIVLTRPADVATDAAGTPLNFLHVSSGAGGSGTIADPYGTLTDALADGAAGTSIIYTPLGGSYIEDITLPPGATLLSNGPLQFIETQCGPQLLPFSGASRDLSMLPTLTGNVTLSDDTRFSGFDVRGGITAAGVTDVTLDNHVVSNLAGDAITLMGVDGAALETLRLTSLVGRGMLLDDSDVTAADVTIVAAADDGVEINSAGTDRRLDFTNLIVGAASAEGMDVNVGGAGDLTVSLHGTNSITSAGNALDAALSGAAGDLVLSLRDITLASTSGAGANLDGSAGAGLIFIDALSNVTVATAMAGGFLADTVTFDADPGTAAIDVVDVDAMTIGNIELLADVTGDGLRLIDPTGALSVTTLDVFNDMGTGLLVDTKGGGTTFALATGPDSTILTINGPAMFLDPLDVDLRFDVVGSGGSPGSGIFIDTVTGAIDIGATNILGSVATSIVIQNTPAPLSASFGETTILSTISDAIGDNVDVSAGNGMNLSIEFDSLEITGP